MRCSFSFTPSVSDFVSAIYPDDGFPSAGYIPAKQSGAPHDALLTELLLARPRYGFDSQSLRKAKRDCLGRSSRQRGCNSAPKRSHCQRESARMNLLTAAGGFCQWAEAHLPRQSMERSADVVLVQSSSSVGNEENVRGCQILFHAMSTRRSADPHRSAGVKEPH